MKFRHSSLRATSSADDPARPLTNELLNASKVMSSSQVELPNAARSRTERETAPQGLKSLRENCIPKLSPAGTVDLQSQISGSTCCLTMQLVDCLGERLAEQKSGCFCRSTGV